MINQLESKTAYEDWHSRLQVDDLANAPWHQLIREHMGAEDLAGKRVLEIGCGRGGFACWMARQRPAPSQIVAADFSFTAVQKGRQFASENGLSRIAWEVMDIEAITHESGSFDTVISCETIEHVPDPWKAVKELGRVLKPGGKLFLTTPNYLGAMGLYRLYLRLRGRRFSEEGQPINNFMLLPRTRGMVAAAGLKIRAVDGVGHYLPIKGRPPVEAPFFNNPRMLMRWVALHSLTIGEKPA